MNAKRIFYKVIITCLVALFGLSACWPIQSAQQEPGVLYTAAAQTVMAQLTLSAGETAVALLTQIAQVTPTPVAPTTAVPTLPPPTDTAVPTFATPTATSTATPTVTPFVPTVMPTYLPTATWSPPTLTPTAIACNWAQYVKDVTVPDGTVFAPGQAFTKTWRLRNIGSCSWMPGYSLVFHSGDRMHTRSTVPLNVTVFPGATVDVSVDMIAPSQPGQYRSYWMLSTTTGQLFGIGARADSPFWVDIQVVATTAYAFDFIREMCNASWRSSTKNLPCPGDPTSQDGAVIRLDQPSLENGKLENEPALMTLPAHGQEGWIMGIYPLYKVHSGDHFTTDIGCLSDSQGCDVTFYLSFQLPGQAMQDLGSWHEVFDGQITRVNMDLSFLAGQSVQFILRVVNHGKATKATAFWLVPSIRR
jgi:hypothetical protein